MCAFSHFAVDDLVKFEYQMLTRLEYFIVPLASPVSFVRHLLHVGVLTDDVRYTEEIALSKEAGVIIGHYWEGSESLLYSPSIIGFAALVIAFSKLNLQCRGWLDSLPDECFHCMSSTISSNVIKKYPAMYVPSACAEEPVADCFAFERVLITVDLCIRSMKAVPAISTLLSPVAVCSGSLVQRSNVIDASSQDDEVDMAEVGTEEDKASISSPVGRSNVPSPTGVVDCMEEVGMGSPKPLKATTTATENEKAPSAIDRSNFFNPATAGCKRKRSTTTSVISLLGRPKRKSGRIVAQTTATVTTTTSN